MKSLNFAVRISQKYPESPNKIQKFKPREKVINNKLNSKADLDTSLHQTDAGFSNSDQTRDAAPANVVFLSLHQAAKMTGYHQDYLGQMARSGKLEAIKVGRNWQTTKKAIDKMLGREPAPTEIKPVVKIETAVSVPEPVKVVSEIPNKIYTPQVSLPVMVKREEVIKPVVSPLATSLAPEILESQKPVFAPVNKPVAVQIERQTFVNQTVKNIVPQSVAVKPETKIPAPQPVKVLSETPRPIMQRQTSFAKRVQVNFLNTSKDAGPNVQEAIASYVEPEYEPGKNVDREGRNILNRWNKLSGPKRFDSTNKIFSHRHYELTQMQPEKFEPVAVKKSKSSWVYAASGIATIVLLASAYFGTSYINQTPDNTLSSLLPNEKRVAGESTSVVLPTTGKGTIEPELYEYVVKNSNVKLDSTILITFKADYAGRHWISEQSDGQFTIKLSEPVKISTPFDYMIMADSEGGSP